MKRQTVLVLFGGMSNEYEISLRSAKSILENLDAERFEAVKVGITRDGRWLMTGASPEAIQADNWMKGATMAVLSPDRSVHGLIVTAKEGLCTINIDVIFPAVHGKNCEDGVLQGLLELSGVPYVGCGCFSSAVCFDKTATHILCEQAGISMARWISAKIDDTVETIARRVKEQIGFPAFVKPANSGSSMGTAPAHDEAALAGALSLAFAHDDKVLIEELIVAREVECAVLGNRNAEAPTTAEIVTPDGFYDYDAKYVNQRAKLLVPADIPQHAQDEVRRLALKTYRTLDCKGLARVDFFVKADGAVYLNEINTLPGFTSISMYPRMLQSAGYTYPQLISRLLELAIEEKELTKPTESV
jgi:D-alanine-D-alanine ligase